MRLRPILVTRRGPSSNHWWEILRRIRNACAPGLTHRTTEITPEEQQQYRRHFPENVRHYLYVNEKDEVVAFSRLAYNEDDGLVYPTYGVDPTHRGNGYAWEVVKHAMLAAGGPLRGDLLVSNEAIKKVDYALGWRPVGEPEDGVQQVEADWPPAFVKELL